MRSLRWLGPPLLVALCSCGGGEPVARPTPCPDPSGTEDLAPLPPEIPLRGFGTITEVESKRDAIAAVAVTDTQIVELYPPLARAVLDAGYDIVSSDNEGFEAEIFFSGKGATGAYRMREGPCGDQVTVKLLYVDSERTRGR